MFSQIVLQCLHKFRTTKSVVQYVKERLFSFKSFPILVKLERIILTIFLLILAKLAGFIKFCYRNLFREQIIFPLQIVGV